MNMAKIFKKIHKICYQWLCICRKNIIKRKLSMPYYIGVANLSCTWWST